MRPRRPPEEETPVRMKILEQSTERPSGGVTNAEIVDYKETETAETFERRYFWMELEPWEVAG